jgi:glycosyltransferase involved in cell wall biosynthesis
MLDRRCSAAHHRCFFYWNKAPYQNERHPVLTNQFKFQMRTTSLLTKAWRGLSISVAQCNRYLKPTISSTCTATKDAPFAEFVRAHLDQQAYLEAYPDVRSAGIDPVKHWLEAGMAEGRSFFPDATFCHGDQARQVEGAEWLHFSWNEKPVAVRMNTPTEDALFAEFVKAQLDERAYLEAYSDVRSAGIDPVKHWLEAGMNEGRFLHPSTTVALGDIADRLDSTHWKHFTWRGRSIAVRTFSPIKPSLISQIKAQARHDPTVLAAGALAIDKLHQVYGTDLLGRGGVDVRSIFTAITERPDVVVLVPHLGMGGAEKFAADLIDALSALKYKTILVIVTDDNAKTAVDWESLAILAPLQATRVMFWPDVCGFNCKDPRYLARLLNALRPSKIIVLNSCIGNDMIARFGRGLSQFAKLYSVYFDLGMQGLCAPVGARWPHRTLQFSLALTDNAEMAATLRRQWGELPGPGISVLPPRLQPAEDRIFSARLMARQTRVENATRSLRWVWVSRVEPFKGTTMLAELASMRPADHFDLFGSVEGDLNEMGLILPNITHQGFLTDVSSADFTDYDGFLFTSLFEGMPNIVLEMSQHAIPMALADVSGLRDTFDDTSVHFVRYGEDTLAIAKAFACALDNVAALTPTATLAMVRAARKQALARHAPDIYLKNVAEIFEIPVNHV